MARHLPTFSALNRASICPASAVLPRSGSVSPFAASGSAVHRFLQRCLEIGREKALGDIPPEDRDLCELLDVESLPTDPKAFAGEIAFALDVATGKAREIGRGLERDYGEIGPTELVGTVDVGALLGTDGVYIGDYKKGWSHGLGTPPPEKNLQLKAGLVAACRAWKRPRGRVEIIRIFDDGGTYRSTADLGPADVDAAQTELTRLATRVLRDRKDYSTSGDVRCVTGSHCTYCGSIPYCPAKMALARAAIGGDSTELARIAKEGTALITAENAARLYGLIHDAENVVKQVKEAIRDFARVTPVPLPDGRVYGVNPDSEEREIVDGGKAMEALRSIFGDEAVRAATIEVTFAGIDRATKAFLGEAIKRGDLKSYASKAEELLKQRGLLRVTKGGVVRAYKPKRAT